MDTITSGAVNKIPKMEKIISEALLIKEYMFMVKIIFLEGLISLLIDRCPGVCQRERQLFQIFLF